MAAITNCSEFGAPKIKSDTVSTVCPSISQEVMGLDDMQSLLFFGTLYSDAYIFPFLLCFSPLLFSQLFVRPPQTAILLFCISFPWGWSWSLPPIHCYKPPSIVLQALYQIYISIKKNQLYFSLKKKKEKKISFLWNDSRTIWVHVHFRPFKDFKR